LLLLLAPALDTNPTLDAKVIPDPPPDPDPRAGNDVPVNPFSTPPNGTDIVPVPTPTPIPATPAVVAFVFAFALEAAVENVDLTFDSSVGRIPCSGSSTKGFGNVVSPVDGDGRTDDEEIEGVGSAMSTALSDSDMMLEPHVVSFCRIEGAMSKALY
jgi:hypothetical protein